MKIKDITLTAMFVALIAVCAWIYIPTTVPFTLQTFAVFMAVGVLGGKRSAIAIVTYILLGALGAPVFSQFRGGIGMLISPTGGYIVGFLASVLVIWVLTRLLGERPLVLILSMLAGLLVLYAFGTAWFMVVYTRTKGAVTLAAALSWCVLPFLIPDLIKIALAAVLSKRLKSIMQHG